MLNLKDIDYYLPQELIAQEPLTQRDHCRLMQIDRKLGFQKHCFFYELLDFLRPDDVLVFNNTKVIKARLFGQKLTGGKVEIFLLEPVKDQIWQVLIYPTRRVKEGELIKINDHFEIRVIKKHCEDNTHLVELLTDQPVNQQIEVSGNIPLLPYIKASKENSNQYQELYQTIYAKEQGSVASPTAGLHFTRELIDKLINKGIQLEYLTLHVGLGTFLPIKTDNVFDHKMHKEWYQVDASTAKRLTTSWQTGKRIIAVGSTATRVLESVFHQETFVSGSGYTNIFIYPGYEFKAIKGLITNFHLPKSTLLLMIMAFANKNIIDDAYKIAIENRYRFYSFGDAMMLT